MARHPGPAVHSLLLTCLLLAPLAAHADAPPAPPDEETGDAAAGDDARRGEDPGKAPAAAQSGPPPLAATQAGSTVPPVRARRYEVGRNGVLEVGGAAPPASRWRGAPISLSLRDAPLPEVLRTFAKVADVNLVLDPRVQGLVTVELKDVPWDQALYVILKTHGMAAEIDGRVWLVTPD